MLIVVVRGHSSCPDQPSLADRKLWSTCTGVTRPPSARCWVGRRCNDSSQPSSSFLISATTGVNWLHRAANGVKLSDPKNQCATYISLLHE